MVTRVRKPFLTKFIQKKQVVGGNIQKATGRVRVSRRVFLQMAWTMAGAWLLPSRLLASAGTYRFERQLRLIEGIRNYCSLQIGMQLGNSFYTQWERQQKGMSHYLYVSEAAQVKVPTGLREYWYFGTDAAGAYADAAWYERQGYHTMVYKTAGTSATLLSETLLSYQLESIATVVFHEALHVHLRSIQRQLPLFIEEAAADVLSYFLTKEYQEGSIFLNPKLGSRLLQINEKIYEEINETIGSFSENSHEYKQILARCQRKIRRILKKGNEYLQNRFDHRVNNAFLLRNSFYSKYYFEIKAVYECLGSAVLFLDYLAALPNDSKKALEKIRETLQLASETNFKKS